MTHQIVEHEVKSWAELQQFLSPPPGLNEHSWRPLHIFRGQGKAAWPLRSSLHRLLLRPDGSAWSEATASHTEKEACLCFLRQFFSVPATEVNTNVEDVLNCWMVMQHFGAPTRLLDWTESPYVAVYFSVVDNWHEDGAIWRLQCGVLEGAMPPKKTGEAFDGMFICATNQELIDFLQPSASPSIRIVWRAHHSPRMRAQQGLFTLSNKILLDYDQLIRDIVRSSVGKSRDTAPVLHKYVIPARLKPEILLRLNAMNITALSLFPGLDGLGRSVRERVMFESGANEQNHAMFRMAKGAGTNSVTICADGTCRPLVPVSEPNISLPGATPS